MLNAIIRGVSTLTGTTLVGLGIWDGVGNIMPEVDPMQLIYVGAALLGVVAAPKIKSLNPAE